MKYVDYRSSIPSKKRNSEKEKGGPREPPQRPSWRINTVPAGKCLN